VRAFARLLAPLLVAFLCALTAQGAAVQVSDQARAHFKQGVAYLTQPGGADYAKAYEQFKQAYADSPSPKILGNLGLCAAKLERDGEAIAAYRRYLEGAGAKSARERRQIEADVRMMTGRVSWLRLEGAPAGAAVTDRRTVTGAHDVVNEYVLGAGDMELGLRAGEHELVIEAEGYQARTLRLSLEAGKHRVKVIALAESVEAPGAGGAAAQSADGEPDAASPGGDLWPWFWVGVGVTGASAIATGVVGGLAWSNKGSYDDAVAAGDSAGASDLRDSGQTLNVVGDVLLTTAAVSAAATVVLLIVALGQDGDAGGDAPAAYWVAPTAGGLVVGGMF